MDERWKPKRVQLPAVHCSTWNIDVRLFCSMHVSLRVLHGPFPSWTGLLCIVSVKGRCSVSGAAVASPQGARGGGEKGTEERVSALYTVSITLLLLLLLLLLSFSSSAHFSGFTAHTPESPMKHTCVSACMHTHTHTHTHFFHTPQRWFTVTPLISLGSTRWVRVRGEKRRRKGQNIMEGSEKWGEQRARSGRRNDEQSGLQSFEEAAGALRSTTCSTWCTALVLVTTATVLWSSIEGQYSSSGIHHCFSKNIYLYIVLRNIHQWRCLTPAPGNYIISRLKNTSVAKNTSVVWIAGNHQTDSYFLGIAHLGNKSSLK